MKWKVLKPKRIGQRFKSNREKDKEYIRNAGRKRVRQYKIDHPACEVCQLKGKIKPAYEAHHIKGIKKYLDMNVNVKNLVNDINSESNLLSVCKQCHREIERMKNEEAEELYRKLEGIEE